MTQSQHDNTNSGALFEPSNQKFLQQGIVDVNGKKVRIAIITYPDKNGDTVFDVYVKQGRIWDNSQDKENEKAPDASGQCYLMGSKKRLAMWKNTSKDGSTEYMSVKVQSIKYED